MASTKSARAHVDVSPQNCQYRQFLLKIHEQTLFFYTEQVQKHTSSCSRLAITLANDCTQNLEEPKNFLKLAQNFHTTRIDESHLFFNFARLPDQLETNGFHH